MFGLKILVVIHSLARGGAERVVSLLTQEWARNHQVRIALYDVRGQSYPVGGRIINLDSATQCGALSRLINPLIRVWRLAVLFNRERPDRIITFMESANLPSVLAAIIVGMTTRLIVSVRNNPDHFPRYYRWLMPILYRFANRVVPVSEGIGNRICKMGIPNHLIKAIPNPVNLSEWDFTTENNVSNDTDWTHYSPFILAVGRLHRQKGFDQLIDAFALIGDDNLHLIILGDGCERKNLEAQVARLGLGEKVLLPGVISNPGMAYRRAQCFVLSSRYEGWPNVLIEAMTCGCPVVSFACDYGPSEIIEGGKSGLLVADGDKHGLVCALKRLCYNEQLRQSLGQTGQARMRQFDVRTVAKKWLQ